MSTLKTRQKSEDVEDDSNLYCLVVIPFLLYVLLIIAASRHGDMYSLTPVVSMWKADFQCEHRFCTWTEQYRLENGTHLHSIKVRMDENRARFYYRAGDCIDVGFLSGYNVLGRSSCPEYGKYGKEDQCKQYIEEHYRRLCPLHTATVVY